MFPARAGVILAQVVNETGSYDVPRASGGDPVMFRHEGVAPAQI